MPGHGKSAATKSTEPLRVWARRGAPASAAGGDRKASTGARNRADFLLKGTDGLGFSALRIPRGSVIKAGCNADQDRALCVQRTARVARQRCNVGSDQVQI